MKIINTDSKPYEWTFNGCIYGPLMPGQIADYPEEVAIHAVKRGVVLDEAGDFVRYRCEMLSNVPKDKISDLALFECPFINMGQCDAKPFKRAEDLRAHLESHWELSGKPEPNKLQASPQTAKRI